MNKNKLLATSLALTLATTLTACSNSEDNEEIINDTNLIKHFGSIEEGEKHVFEPYEQLFFIRYNEVSSSTEYTTSGYVNIPDGYEVISIEQFYEPSYSTSKTGGYDIWYTNTKTVEVESIYNEAFNRYDFSQFGKVIETEKNDESEKPKVNTRKI